MAAIVGLCLLPAAVLGASLLWQDRARGQRDAWAEAQRVGRLATAHHAAMVQGARTVLETLARFPEIAQPDAARCDAVIVSLHRAHPEYSTLGVYDRDGRAVCSATRFTGNLSDRPYFQTALAGEFGVGSYVHGRITGNHVLPLAQPVRDSAGRVAAVIVLGVLPSWIEPLFHQAQLPADAHIGIVNGRGTIVARYPAADRYVGQSTAGRADWQRLQDRPGDTVLATAGVDGIAKLLALVPLGAAGPEGQAYIAVGLPRADAIASANRLLLRHALVIGLAAVLGVAAALAGGRAWVLLPARRLMAAAARLGVGDLATRAGPPYPATELGALARAFDDMAGRLEARDREARAASAEILDREARLAAVVGSAMDAIITVDEDHRVTLFNAAAERIFRCPAAAALGQPLDRLIPEPLRARHREHLHAFGRGEEARRAMDDRAALTGLRADGEKFPMEASLSHVKVNGRRIYAAVLRDVTERRRTEEARRFLAERLRTLHDLDRLILDGVPVEQMARSAADRMRTLASVSHVSIAVPDAPGGPWTLLAASGPLPPEWTTGGRVPPSGLGSVEALARGECQVLPVPGRIPHHDRAPAGAAIDQLVAVPVRAEGELIGAVNIGIGASGRPAPEVVDAIREVADQVAVGIRQSRFREAVQQHAATLERQVAERTAQFEALSSDMEAFAYTVAHDLRAPVRAMQGISQALLDDYGDRLDERGLDLATRVVRAAERMDALIQDLLTYSRVSRAHIVPERLSLQTPVDDAVHQLEEVLAEARATVTVERPLPDVIGERQVLAQVLVNLLSNAAKFVRPGTAPRIRVRADGHDGAVRLWVEDDGIGIAPEHRERVFRGFERLHGREAYPGTGLGLAIVKKGVERCGGRAGVESAEGGGSRFWIELPPGGPAE
jgi:PAS domain S-box-containing protein